MHICHSIDEPSLALALAVLLDLSCSLTGSVKDSVVGEERIAQYLLAVLDTRGTPLHWKHLNNRRIDGITYEAEENDRYNLKNLKRRKNLPNRSDLVYVEVTNSINGIQYFELRVLEIFTLHFTKFELYYTSQVCFKPI